VFSESSSATLCSMGVDAQQNDGVSAEEDAKEDDAEEDAKEDNAEEDAKLGID